MKEEKEIEVTVDLMKEVVDGVQHLSYRDFTLNWNLMSKQPEMSLEEQ